MEYLFISDLSEFYAENCGIAILSPGWIHSRRNIDTSVLILGHQGEVSLRQENQPIQISSSRYCFLSEGRDHWGTEKLCDKARYYWIHFKSAHPPQIIPEKEARLILTSKEIARTRLKNGLLFPQQGSLENSHVIREAFHELLYVQQNGSFTDQKYQSLVRLMMIQLNEMVMEKYHSRESGEHQKRKSLVNKIIQLIYENLTDRNFSVKSLADIMCYNPDYLNRHFKIIMKRSLIEYIIDKRVDYSLVQLIDSNLSLSAIAQNSGFSSYRNYIRQFKLRKDMIPSEYRNRHRMMHITNE